MRVASWFRFIVEGACTSTVTATDCFPSGSRSTAALEDSPTAAAAAGVGVPAAGAWARTRFSSVRGRIPVPPIRRGRHLEQAIDILNRSPGAVRSSARPVGFAFAFAFVALDLAGSGLRVVGRACPARPPPTSSASPRRVWMPAAAFKYSGTILRSFRLGGHRPRAAGGNDSDLRPDPRTSEAAWPRPRARY